jgi:carotenoid cleavage dioxygenase
MFNFNFKPVSKEKYITIPFKTPDDLINIIYLRNGANPYLKNVDNHLFDGDGMIHSFYFTKNKLIYHNKWIRTYRFKIEKKYNKPLFVRLANLNTIEIFSKFFSKLLLFQNVTNKYGDGTANTNIVFHHNKLLALNEMDKPYLLGFDEKNKLITIKRYDFHGQLQNNINPHPKIDPDSKDMITLGYDVFKKMCFVNFINLNGDIFNTIPVQLKQSTIIHDVGMTKNKVVILNLPLHFELMNVVLSQFPIGVNKNHSSSIGILDKISSKIVWYNLPFDQIIFHIANCWENDYNIIIYAFCYEPESFNIKNLETQRPRLKKIIIDTLNNHVSIILVSKLYGELPVIQDNLTGKEPDYIYYSKISKHGFNAIVKHHVPTQNETIKYFPKYMYGGECALYNNYIINIGFSITDNLSRLLIYDKYTLELLFNINLKCRIPFGFHGKVFDFDSIKNN